MTESDEAVTGSVSSEATPPASRWHVRFGFDGAAADPERLVTPGVVFVSARHPKLAPLGGEGFAIHFGWWHWSFRVSVLRLAARSASEDTQPKATPINGDTNG